MDVISNLFYILNHDSNDTTRMIAKGILLRYQSISIYTLEALAEELNVSLSCLKTFFRKYDLGSYHVFIKNYTRELNCIFLELERDSKYSFIKENYFNEQEITISGKYESIISLVPLQKYLLVQDCLLMLEFCDIHKIEEDLHLDIREIQKILLSYD